MNDAGRLEALIDDLDLGAFREIILESSNTRFIDGKLVWLDLGCKDLRSIPENLFDEFAHLEYIGLYGNQLGELPPKIFSKLEHLKILDIGENDLNTLPRGIFERNRHLKYLWMYSNSLEHLPEGIFKNLQLKELNLNSNKLLSFPFELVAHMSELETLEIALNQFSEMDIRLKGLPKLSRLVFNVYVDGNLHIINHLAKEEEEIEETVRKDVFVLVTGVMGSGKSTLMSQYSGSKVQPRLPPVGKNILYDNLFGIVIDDSRIANFFEIDGPTVTSWIKFIEISSRVLIIVNSQMHHSKHSKIEDLLFHVREHLGDGGELIVVLNNCEKELEGVEDARSILEGIAKRFDFSGVKIYFLRKGEIRPDIGGMQKVILNNRELNRIFDEVAFSLRD